MGPSAAALVHRPEPEAAALVHRPAEAAAAERRPAEEAAAERRPAADRARRSLAGEAADSHVASLADLPVARADLRAAHGGSGGPLLGQTDEALHRLPGTRQRRNIRPPLIRRRHRTLQVIERRRLLRKLLPLLHRIATVIAGIAGVLPVPIATGFPVRAVRLVLRLHRLATLLGHFGPTLRHKAVESGVHPRTIATLPGHIECRQRIAEVLQVTHVVLELVSTAPDLCPTGVAFHPTHRLRLHRTDRQHRTEQQRTTDYQPT